MYCLVLVDERGRERPLVREAWRAPLEVLGRQIQATHPRTRWRVIDWEDLETPDRTPDQKRSP
jgi:hypothetical protein